MKRISVIFISLFIVVFPVLPTCSTVVYADDDYGDYLYANTNAFVYAAVKTYLNWRNFFTVAPTAHALGVQYVVNEGFNLIGTTPEEFRDNLRYKYGTDGKLQFLFTPALILQLTDMYDALMEKYGLSANTTKIVYSGKKFIDADGNQALVWVISQTGTFEDADYSNYITKTGSFYKYKGDTLSTMQSASFNLLSNFTYTGDMHVSDTWSNNSGVSTWFIGSGSSHPVFCNEGYHGGGTIIYTDGSETYLGTYLRYTKKSDHKLMHRLSLLATRNLTASTSDQNVSANQREPRPNFGSGSHALKAPKAGTPEDVLDDDEQLIPEEVDNPPQQQPVDPGSVTPNPDNPTINPGNEDFNFQMPNINIDWHLNMNVDNLPFPFSIPSDLNKAFKKIDVEPEAPDFSNDIHLGFGTWSYIWEFEFDLEDYDEQAEIFRKWFLFIYIIGLIIATRAIKQVI